ncbi:hypothetical protein CDAR_430111 [Caerostris darwini]|uniref:Uncharacterized protein n=1 Tax=Caerostris darwini TaxID=1538125 RepID=A0AAV4WEG2_9ARAC|nr:hypothetical protein CDAR_430111 [Caerostris darwini]
MTTNTAICHGRDENEFQGRMLFIFLSTGISTGEHGLICAKTKYVEASRLEFSEWLSYCGSWYPSSVPYRYSKRPREIERPPHVLTLRNC